MAIKLAAQTLGESLKSLGADRLLAGIEAKPESSHTGLEAPVKHS
jgi:hypothetical protein